MLFSVPEKHLTGREQCRRLLPLHLGLWVKHEEQTIMEGSYRKTMLKVTFHILLVSKKTLLCYI